MEQTNSVSIEDLRGDSGFDLMAMIAFELKKVRKMLLDLEKEIKGKEHVIKDDKRTKKTVSNV